MNSIIFEPGDVGCYADGRYGQHLRREIMACLIESILPNNSDSTLADELRGEVPVDYSDEDDAMDILQSVTANGIVWIIEEGGLYLIEQETDKKGVER